MDNYSAVSVNATNKKVTQSYIDHFPAHVRMHACTYAHTHTLRFTHSISQRRLAVAVLWTCCRSGGQNLSHGWMDEWMGVCGKVDERYTKVEYKRSKFTKSATVLPHFSSEFSWKYHLLTHVDPAVKLTLGP